MIPMPTAKLKAANIFCIGTSSLRSLKKQAKKQFGSTIFLLVNACTDMSEMRTRTDIKINTRQALTTSFGGKGAKARRLHALAARAAVRSV
jgi:hypothetical protein